MKKRLFAILLALTLALTLLPVTAYADDEGSADLGTISHHCNTCNTDSYWKILEFIKSPIAGYDPVYHWIRIQCPNCPRIDETHPSGALGSHSGGTETPTCTTGKTCEKCGEEYGKLGHDWGAWTYNGDGTHSRICQRDTTHVEIENCNGTATCQAPAKCTVCGAERGKKSNHSFSVSWRSDTEQHWHYCLTRGCDAKSDVGYHNINDNHYCPTCYTSPIPCMDTDNDHKCDGCGKTISDHTGGTANCHTKAVCEVCKQEYGDFDTTNHDGGTEVKNAKAATCTEKGYTGDTHCKGCGVKLADGKDIPALDHNWGKWTPNGDGTHTRTCSRDKSHSENGKCSGGTATCKDKAKCAVCGAEYGQLDPSNHANLKHVPAKRSTTRTEGNSEYWYCDSCGKYFRDAAATKEITKADTVIAKRSGNSGFTGATSGTTSNTGKDTVKSSNTGDAGIALYIGMAALSLSGGAWLRRRKP